MSYYRCQRAKDDPAIAQKTRDRPASPVSWEGAAPREFRPGESSRTLPGAAPILLRDLADNPRTDGAATFADREAQALIHRDRCDQLDADRDVVARHDHLGALGEDHFAGHVGGAEVELRAVVGEERRVTATFVLRQHVDFGAELGVRVDRAGLGQDLATLDAVTRSAAQQRADVVAGLAAVEQLAEHLDAGDDGLRGRPDADDFYLVADVHGAAL